MSNTQMLLLDCSLRRAGVTKQVPIRLQYLSHHVIRTLTSATRLGIDIESANKHVHSRGKREGGGDRDLTARRTAVASRFSQYPSTILRNFSGSSSLPLRQLSTDTNSRFHAPAPAHGPARRARRPRAGAPRPRRTPCVRRVAA